MRYQRVLVKLSGGAFAGTSDAPFAREAIEHLADEVLAVAAQGIQVAIMVGGGNIFRGRIADEWGIERAEADNIGMMATVINSLILRGALNARGDAEVRVMSAIPMAAIAEPFIRLRAIKHLEKGYIVIFAAGTGQPFVTTDYPAVQRAIEIRADVILAAKQGVDGVYTADPRTDPTARRFRALPYDEVIQRGLAVMDQSAIILARDYQLPIAVFDASANDSLIRICAGDDVGTYIGPDVDVVLDDAPAH
jgi:uridylate kinase